MRLVFGCAAGIALIGTAIGLFAPASWFDWFQARVVGGELGSVTSVPPEHRVIAICGALLAGLGLLLLRRHRPAPSQQIDRRLLAAAALPFAALVVLNAWWAGARYAMWAWPAPAISQSYRPLVYALGALVLVAMYKPVLRGRMYRPAALVEGFALGGGYGLFSALWHCCPPLWDTWSGSGWQAALSTTGFLTLFAFAGLGMLTAVATQWTAPRGEIIGGLLLALFYPWHTFAWAVQCFAGGLLCTWLARRTGSYLAPGAFLITAYLTHMTLPYLGWIGAATAVVFLGSVALVTWQRRRGPLLDHS